MSRIDECRPCAACGNCYPVCADHDAKHVAATINLRSRSRFGRHPADSDPVYRSQMRDAGRGSLLR